jgi:monofunctional glycosyltransferase
VRRQRPAAERRPGRWRRRLAALALGVAVAIVAVWASLPPIAELARETPRSTAYMRFRAHELGLPDGTFSTDPTPLDRIGPLVTCAIVKAEDGSFFEHNGFDVPQIRRAFERVAQGGPAFGASTLSQQLARNLFLTPQRSVLRKSREALLTYELERSLPKRRILELYLNVVEWGADAWGVGPAARAYFQKPPEALDAFEASVLASLLAAPRAALTGANLDRAIGVQRRVLQQLYASDLIDDAERASAFGRSSALRGALAQGTPLPEALRLASAAPPSPKPPPMKQLGPPLPRAEALATSCGHAHELAYRARFLEQMNARPPSPSTQPGQAPPPIASSRTP